MLRTKTLYFLSRITFVWLFSVCVIYKTQTFPHDFEENGRKYYFGDTEKLLVGYETYGKHIKLGKWNQSIYTYNIKHGYNEEWAKIFKMMRLPPGCNAVDIGANDGNDVMEHFCEMINIFYR